MNDTPLRLALAAVRERFPLGRCMETLAELASLDRYQASAGIETAADLVAVQAEQAGLQNVEVLHLPADGNQHWWTFRAPRAWTPTWASLEVANHVLAHYPRDACSLATYSAPTGSAGVVAPLVVYESTLPDDRLSGAIVVIPRSPDPLEATIARLEEARALGFATDVPGRSIGGSDYAGRIELDLDSRLFAFSLGQGTARRLTEYGRLGRSAKAVVRIEPRGSAPLVTGVLPGSGSDEILLVAHLCHPRPGANDNASGVVALLGLAQSLGRITRSAAAPRGIRFLWGPEFIATAAYLDAAIRRRTYRLPICAINLDMVGEDPSQCGGPMIIEHCPPHLPSPLNAMADRCAEIVAEEASPTGESDDALPWHWEGMPFRGRSDHLLLVDPAIGVPAIELSHWPDSVNHSAADTPDKVLPAELHRCASIAGAIALTIAYLNPADGAWLTPLVAAGEARRLADFVRRREAFRLAAADPDLILPGWVAASRAAQAALQATAALAGGPPSPQLGRLTARLAGQASSPTASDDSVGLRPGGPIEDVPIRVRRRWDGPFNPRALLEGARGSTGAGFHREMLSDPARAYTELVAVALALDQESSRDQVLRRAADRVGMPIGGRSGNSILDALIDNGWAEQW